MREQRPTEGEDSPGIAGIEAQSSHTCVMAHLELGGFWKFTPSLCKQKRIACGKSSFNGNTKTLHNPQDHWTPEYLCSKTALKSIIKSVLLKTYFHTKKMHKVAPRILWSHRPVPPLLPGGNSLVLAPGEGLESPVFRQPAPCEQTPIVIGGQSRHQGTRLGN